AAVVRGRYHREGMGAAFRILGEGQLSLTKFLMLVDEPRDLGGFTGLLGHVLARFYPRTDLYRFAMLSWGTVDLTRPEVRKGSKGVMLGLGEPHRVANRALPCDWKGELPRGAREPNVFCAGCLVVGGPTFEEDKDFAGALAGAPGMVDWPLIVLCDRPAQA